MQFQLLSEPHGKVRPQLPPLNDEALFYLTTGQTEASLRPGRIVEVRQRFCLG